MPQHEEFAAVEEALRCLPVEERAFLLMASLIERRPEAMASLTSMAAAIGTMGAVLDLPQRFALAEALRTIGDQLEHEQVLMRA